MSTTRHGLTVGIETIGDEVYLSLKAIGTLTHQDYQTISPMLDAAVQGLHDPHIKALVDGTELDGWELRAAWDDFKLGLKHGSEFTRIAIYGNRNWQQFGARIGAWFVSGEVRYFEDHSAAIDWLSE